MAKKRSAAQRANDARLRNRGAARAAPGVSKIQALFRGHHLRTHLVPRVHIPAHYRKHRNHKAKGYLYNTTGTGMHRR